MLDMSVKHRLVMERRLGRYLLASEVIHHINGDKQDNRIDNLEVHTLSSHGQLHYRKGDYSRLGKSQK